MRGRTVRHGWVVAGWLLSVALGASLSAAHAREATIARAAEFSGLISVRIEGRNISTAKPIRLPRDSRVRAGPLSGVTIYYDNGCKERLEPMQAIIIRDPPPCFAPAYLAKGLIISGVAVAVGLTLKRDFRTPGVGLRLKPDPRKPHSP